MLKPIKRHEALQPISREHHHGLLLCWKIREGLRLKINPTRIKRYTEWFWTTSLHEHFNIEEMHIFPILGNENDLIKKALKEHHRLQQLFTFTDENIEQNLVQIEQELTAHIRFEERILFNEIQQVASEQQLSHVEKTHRPKPTKNWDDEYWIQL